MPECDYSEWQATLDSMPPGPAQLHVTARGSCPRAGCEAKLVRQEPQGINPRDLLLRLEESCPEAGAAVMTEIELRYSEEAESGQYDTVSIVPDGPAGLKVQEVS